MRVLASGEIEGFGGFHAPIIRAGSDSSAVDRRRFCVRISGERQRSARRNGRVSGGRFSAGR